MSRLPDASNLPPARRTMADITALFMSGAAPGGSRPQRIPPRGASSAPLAPSPASPVTPHAGVPAGPVAQRMEVRPPVNGSKSSMPDLTIPAFTKEAGFKDVAFPASTPVPAKATIPPAPTAPMPPVQAAKMPALPQVQAALLDHSTAGSYHVLLEAAKLLAAQHQIAIGIIGRDECVLRLSRVDGSAQAAGKIDPMPPKSGPADLHLARQLFALRQTVSHWIIAVPRLGLDLSRQMLAISPDWLLVSATDNDAIIASYRMLKGVCALPNAAEASIRLLLQTVDQSVAERIFHRLNHVAHEFLQQELELLLPPAANTARVDAVAEFAIVDHEGDDSEAAWLAVLEFLHDLHDLEPDEAEGCLEVEAARTFEIPAALDADIAQNIAVQDAQETLDSRKTMMAEPRVPVTTACEEPETPAPEGLRVSDSVSTSDLLTLRNSLADLIPAATFLDARPPHAAASVLAVDPAGTLHVWMLADSADMTSWGSLWQWAQDHRKLLALTRRDLALRADSPVQMHLILPADAPRAMRQPLPGVQYYRLHTLRWDNRTATAVIPLG